MKKIPSFSEYYKSKMELRLAANNIPEVKLKYELRKYCKVPIIANDDGDKKYVSFRPKDTIEITWEFFEPETPTLKLFSVDTQEDGNSVVRPAWSDRKLMSWLSKNTIKINK